VAANVFRRLTWAEIQGCVPENFARTLLRWYWPYSRLHSRWEFQGTYKLDDAIPYANFSEQLIPTVVKRCSGRKKITINLSSASESLLGSLIPPLKSLKHLTSLSIHQLDSSHGTALQFIGYSCPSLSHLNVHFHFIDTALKPTAFLVS